MPLLPEDKLIWSPVVANSRMNRQRISSGVNSYEKEFKFKPEVFLESKIKEYGKASWLDLCCGEGNALRQVAHYFYNKGLQQKITLTGVDLLNSFTIAEENSFISFETTSVVNYLPHQNYDLITAVHGIHYLGDKLKVIENAMASLNVEGMFIANLGLSNIVIQDNDSSLFLKELFRKNKIEYNSRNKIIKRVGNSDIKFGLTYIGADDTTGPNYSGQDAVTSHYLIK